VCDSVRLTKPTRFPLLKLGSRAGKKGSIRLAVQGRSRRALLSNPGTPDEIEVFRFKPDKRSKRILFGKQPNENGEYRLETADGKRKFWWLAELKPSHGNRVTHKVGEKLTRVGLDESMWLHEQSS
jgi:PAS domain-containing protein